MRPWRARSSLRRAGGWRHRTWCGDRLESAPAEALLVVSPTFRSTPEMAAAGYACYAHVIPGQSAIKGGLKAYGGAIEWLASRLSGDPLPGTELPYERLAAAAEAGMGHHAGPLLAPAPDRRRYARR